MTGGFGLNVILLTAYDALEESAESELVENFLRFIFEYTSRNNTTHYLATYSSYRSSASWQAAAKQAQQARRTQKTFPTN
jgi:hypothetical protein